MVKLTIKHTEEKQIQISAVYTQNNQCMLLHIDYFRLHRHITLCA